MTDDDLRSLSFLALARAISDGTITRPQLDAELARRAAAMHDSRSPRRPTVDYRRLAANDRDDDADG